MTKSVDVVVVTYNSAHVICQLLDSLPDAFGELLYRTVVVDNGSLDSTREIVASRGDCDLVAAQNHGYAAGINRGVEHLVGDGPILVLNPDLRLAPGSVRSLYGALQLPDTGVVGPRVEDESGRLVRSMRRQPTLVRALGFGRTRIPLLSEYVHERRVYDLPQVVDWVLGAVVLVDRACHEALRGWDESFFLYSEETDFCLRAREQGWLTRYEPGARAVHIGAESGQSATTHAIQILNRVRLYRRRHSTPKAFAYFGLTVFGELSWLLRGHPQSRDSLVALLVPSRRPSQLGCSDSLLPW